MPVFRILTDCCHACPSQLFTVPKTQEIRSRLFSSLLFSSFPQAHRDTSIRAAPPPRKKSHTLDPNLHWQTTRTPSNVPPPNITMAPPTNLLNSFERRRRDSARVSWRTRVYGYAMVLEVPCHPCLFDLDILELLFSAPSLCARVVASCVYWRTLASSSVSSVLPPPPPPPPGTAPIPRPWL